MVSLSHYADNHKGTVVDFDIDNRFFCSKEKLYDFTFGTSESDINLEGFDTVKWVNYINNRKHIRIGEYYTLDDIVFTKSIHWSYEGEYRTLKNIFNTEPFRTLPSGENVYLIDVPKPCIKEVIFGLRTEKSAINKSKEMLETSLSDVDIKLSKAKLTHLT